MHDRQKQIIFFSIIVMMISLFVSRAALSVSMAVFTATCFFHTNLRTHLKAFMSSPVLWSMSLLFIIPLISGLWSEDKREWLNLLRIKLPLLVLPLAFASPFSFSKKQWGQLICVFILLVTAGSIWSMFCYLQNIEAVHEGYLHARTMVTPLENDHVRFSWLVSIAVFFSGWQWWENRGQGNISWILLLIAVWLAVFLHILAARTGLLSFYIMLLVSVLWLISKKAKRVYSVALLFAIIALPAIAWWIIPTFRNKVKYFCYDLEFFKDAHYLPGGNDATRVISLKAGWHMMIADPVRGAGFGDILPETKKWYDAHYPQMQPQDKIVPSSEWLIYGTGCGVPGFLLFTFVLLVPFRLRVKNKWAWMLLNFLVAVSFIFDIGLEVQFGVFIYSFIVLLSWKWFRAEA
ncbi:MAG: O-antigen ligase family protein [Chitinophagaceae bacterium]|nr:O-antigen ligase family protein [Chitinophagaceae bacterium]